MGSPTSTGSTTPGSVSALVERLKAGDHDAASQLWHRYYPRLVALARAQLRGIPCRVADEEDAALTAFDTFCRRAVEGRFPDLRDRDDLWALLAVITARKAADLARHHFTDRNGAGLVRGDSALAGPDDSSPGGFDAVPSDEPSPLEAAVLADELDTLLRRLPFKALRQVAVAKLEGLTNLEIAALQRVSVPTVERRLSTIRRLLKPPS